MTLSCGNFSDFPCLWWPWQFWGIPPGILWNVLSMDLPDVFLRVELGFGALERTVRWRAILITSHQGCMLTTWFITEGVHLSDPAYIVFARLEMDYFSTNSSSYSERLWGVCDSLIPKFREYKLLILVLPSISCVISLFRSQLSPMGFRENTEIS